LTDSPIFQVAVLTPRMGCFDYLPPQGPDGPTPSPGVRVRIPFGRRRLIGVVVNIATDSPLDGARLRPIHEVLDTTPVLTSDLLELLQWAAGYYRHPLGDVFRNALPKRLREGHSAESHTTAVWRPTAAGIDTPPDTLRHAPRQAQLLGALRRHPEGLEAAALRAVHEGWREAVGRLVVRGLIRIEQRPCLQGSTGATTQGVALNPDQERAVDQVLAGLGSFGAFALQGVTGSGKTEVYFQLIERVVSQGRQALILVPEIGLTPQLIERFHKRFTAPLAVLHSGLSDTDRHCAWSMARSGAAPVVIGTRSAVFTPLADPGLIVVDEEHDPSLKQQEGFRYHARDLAVFRARQAGIPIILGSATPALETLHNVSLKKYRPLLLPKRAGRARPPDVRIIDVRRKRMEDGVSEPMRSEIGAHLEAGNQVLLFLNRRGYAPALICHDCGWIVPCRRCDTHMTLHREQGLLRCHHCDTEHRIPTRCPQCAGADLRPVGQGTERIEETLGRWFPKRSIVRIDRDTTRRRGALGERLREIREGRHQILIGTQMLSKGHDFPGVTLVGILDIDPGLYSTDFRAPERLAQLVIQVAGRAGRADRPGTVYLQTHLPDHPLIQHLLRADYPGFATLAMEERRLAGLPPFRSLAVLRAEAADREAPTRFLDSVRDAAGPHARPQTQVLGPVPAPMERRAGRYRAQLLIVSETRRQLQHLLDRLLPLDGIPGERRCAGHWTWTRWTCPERGSPGAVPRPQAVFAFSVHVPRSRVTRSRAAWRGLRPSMRSPLFKRLIPSMVSQLDEELIAVTFVATHRAGGHEFAHRADHTVSPPCPRTEAATRDPSAGPDPAPVGLEIGAHRLVAMVPIDVHPVEVLGGDCGGVLGAGTVDTDRAARDLPAKASADLSVQAVHMGLVHSETASVERAVTGGLGPVLPPIDEMQPGGTQMAQQPAGELPSVDADLGTHGGPGKRLQDERPGPIVLPRTPVPEPHQDGLPSCAAGNRASTHSSRPCSSTAWTRYSRACRP